MGEMKQLRIGDAERNEAVEALQVHHQAGRLELGEFEDRMGTALSAKVAGDLYPLFDDLPEPRFAPPVTTANPFAAFGAWGQPAAPVTMMMSRPAQPVAPAPRQRPWFLWVAIAVVATVVLNVMHPVVFALLPALAIWFLIRTDRRIQRRSLANQQAHRPLDSHGFGPGSSRH